MNEPRPDADDRIRLTISRRLFHGLIFSSIGIVSVIGLMVLLAALRRPPTTVNPAATIPEFHLPVQKSPIVPEASHIAQPSIAAPLAPVVAEIPKTSPEPPVQHVAQLSPALKMYAQRSQEEAGRRDAHSMMAYAFELRIFRNLLYKELDKHKRTTSEDWQKYMLLSSTTYAAEHEFWQNMLVVFSGTLRDHGTVDLLRCMAEMATATKVVSESYAQLHALIKEVPDKDSAALIGVVAVAASIATQDTAPLQLVVDAGEDIRKRAERLDKAVSQALGRLGAASQAMSNATLIANAELGTQYLPLLVSSDHVTKRQWFDLCMRVLQHVELTAQRPRDIAPETLASLNAFVNIISASDSDLMQIPDYAKYRSTVTGMLMGLNMLHR